MDNSEILIYKPEQIEDLLKKVMKEVRKNVKVYELAKKNKQLKPLNDFPLLFNV